MVGSTTANNVCRRCKKKRPEDEPMETARYRTCKPCREIERKLKRIKKAQLTGQSVDDIHAEIQSKKAQEIEQNIIQMARQVTNSLPQSDVQGLADAVNGNDLAAIQAHQHQLNAITAAVSAAAAAVQAVNQGPPQIHQYDQSRDNIATQHQPLMPIQSAIDAQKEIPIDESLLKQGTDEDDHDHEINVAAALQAANAAADAAAAAAAAGVDDAVDKASLTKSPILKSEVSPSTTAVSTTTGEQTDSKPTPQQFDNNNNTIINNIENNNNNNNNNNNKQEGEQEQDQEDEGEGEKGDEQQIQEVDAQQAELEASLTNGIKQIVGVKGEGSSSQGATAATTHYCLYCGVERSIEDNGRYNLCGNCVSNPLQKANVYDDFESYLQRIETGQHEDLNNIIFIKKTCDDIPDFTQFDDDEDVEVEGNDEEKNKYGTNNLVDVVTTLNDKYIYRIMDKSGYRFSKSSSNFSAKPFPKSIKLLFKCKQDIKTVQKQHLTSANNTTTTTSTSNGQHATGTVPGGNNSNVNNRRLKTEDCHSNFYLSYDIIAKSLSIKFNHFTHTPYLEKLYTENAIDKVREIATREDGAKEGFLLWKELAEQVEDVQLKSEMSTVKEMVFVKDFGPLFKNFTY